MSTLSGITAFFEVGFSFYTKRAATPTRLARQNTDGSHRRSSVPQLYLRDLAPQLFRDLALLRFRKCR